MATVYERGELFFFYRPESDARPRSIDRVYIVMRPRTSDLIRRLRFLEPPLPSVARSRREHAVVDRVDPDPRPILRELQRGRFETEALGERELPAARPAGEAVYAIVDHEGHRHLAYHLELPRQLGEVQFALGIERETSYIAIVGNPRAPDPLHVPGRPLPRYPNRLQALFHRERYAPLDPRFLDFEGTELVLIAASLDIRRELGIVLLEAHESPAEAAMFRDLQLDALEHPIDPLVAGRWA